MNDPIVADAERDERSATRRASLLAVGLCSAITLALGLLSDGSHHDDDLTHYLMARWCPRHPEYLLHIWGRPGLTLPLALVSWIGDRGVSWHLARALSAAATAASAWLAADVAARIGLRRAWLVVPLLYLQPLVVVLSSTTLTENWTALYLIAAVALLQRDRPVSASLVFSLALVTRHEAVILLPPWWLAMTAVQGSGNRKCAAFAASLWAPAAHNLLFWIVFDEWPVRIFFQSSGSSEYLPSGWLAYLPHAFLAVPPFIAALAVVGGVSPVGRRYWLIPVIPALFLAAHVAFKALGLFASGGYARFMVAVAPFVAILALKGIATCARPGAARSLWIVLAATWLIAWGAIEAETADGRLQLPAGWLAAIRATAGALSVVCLALGIIGGGLLRAGGRRPLVAGCCLMALTCLLQWGAIVRPLPQTSETHAVADVCDWLRNEGLDHRPVFTTHPWFPFFMDLVEHPRAHKGPALLASMPVGTIIVWDSVYSPSDFHRLALEKLQGSAAYRPLRRCEIDGGRRTSFVVFEKILATPLPVTEEAPFPPDLPTRRQPIRGIYYSREK